MNPEEERLLVDALRALTPEQQAAVVELVMKLRAAGPPREDPPSNVIDFARRAS